MLHLLPNKYRTFASNLVHDVQDGMNRYFRGQALVAFCVGILFSIGFLIIDFPMAIALGFSLERLIWFLTCKSSVSSLRSYWRSLKLPIRERISGLSLHAHWQSSPSSKLYRILSSSPKSWERLRG